MKKIFDIIPPSEKSTEHRILRKEKRSVFQKILTKKLWAFLPLIVFFVVSSLLYLLVESKAVVEIWPETSTLELEAHIVLQEAADEVDSIRAILPGRIISTEVSLSQNFHSSGTKVKAERAEGIIRVYNAYSVYDQPLLATTRFVSADGKLFRTPKRVVISGGHYEGRELVPGYTDVEIVAAESGEEYNIKPSIFSIPGFAGTEKYTAFYGKSFESMEGGFKAEVSEVTGDDLAEAGNILRDKIAVEAEKSLESILPSGFIMLVDSIKMENVEVEHLAEAHQELDSFVSQIKGEIKVFVVKESDLKDFAGAFIFSNLQDGKDFNEQSVNIEYYLTAIDLEGGEVALDLNISAQIYSAIDKERLKEDIKDRNPEQIAEFFRSYNDIIRAEAQLSPFWVRKAPAQTQRIEVHILFD